VRKKRQPLGIVFEPTDITANLIDQIVEESSTGTELPHIKDAPVIHEIQPDTPAHFAGLKPGDVVLQVDQMAVKTTDDILRILAASHDCCTLRIDRQSVKKSKVLALQFLKLCGHLMDVAFPIRCRNLNPSPTAKV